MAKAKTAKAIERSMRFSHVKSFSRRMHNRGFWLTIVDPYQILQDFGTEENKTARNGWTPSSNHPAVYLLAHTMFAEKAQC
jgi:hypothetical protein